MDLEAYRDLQLLTDISSQDSVTQRGLAKRYRLALGLTNYLMRRLVKKGYVKIVNLDRRRLRYLITPAGVAEKTRLTCEYLEYSLALYRQIRTLLTSTLSVLLRSGRERIALYGTGELAEIAFLSMQQRGLEVVAVVDDAVPAGTLFMNQPVKGLAALRTRAFDWLVIASFTDHRRIMQRLGQWGVPGEKIVTISERGAPTALATPERPFGAVPETMSEAPVR